MGGACADRSTQPRSAFSPTAGFCNDRLGVAASTEDAVVDPRGEDMSRLLLIALIGALSACATPRTGETYIARGPMPSAEQAERAVRAYLARALKDPDSLKQFAITFGPSPVQWYRGLINGGGNEQAWLVCFEYNAKNSYGAYTGLKTDGVALRMAGSDTVVVPSVNWLIADTRCPGM